ncbi:hypothetical protein LCL87_17745 [Rhodococcus hoagii]|nr:hypothetical protein [Prescottella equi]
MHVSFTSSLNPRQYKTFHGVFMGMCGVALFSGTAIAASAVFDYARGVDGAVTMFALSVGGVSAGVLDMLSRRRRGTGLPIAVLIANFVLTSAGVWLLTDLVPR